MKTIYAISIMLLLFSLDANSQTNLKKVEKKTLKEHELLEQESKQLIERVLALDMKTETEDLSKIEEEGTDESVDIMITDDTEPDDILVEIESEKDRQEKEKAEKIRFEIEEFKMMQEIKHIEEEEKIKLLEVKKEENN